MSHLRILKNFPHQFNYNNTGDATLSFLLRSNLQLHDMSAASQCRGALDYLTNHSPPSQILAGGTDVTIPSNRSLTSRAAFSPSALRSLSSCLDLSWACLSSLLAAQPMVTAKSQKDDSIYHWDSGIARR